MYQIAYIGRWETLPETAAAICDHDTPKLEALLQGGLDLDVPIQLSEYIKLMPLEIAVFRNDVPMIHFLLEHGADSSLAEEQPLLLTAARCCGPEVVALFAGQAAKLSSKQKERAFQEVRWASARRISRCWSKPGLQWRSLAARHSGPLCPRAIPNLPGCFWKRGRHQLSQAGHGVPLRLHPCHRGRPLQQFPYGALAH